MSRPDARPPVFRMLDASQFMMDACEACGYVGPLPDLLDPMILATKEMGRRMIETGDELPGLAEAVEAIRWRAVRFAALYAVRAGQEAVASLLVGFGEAYALPWAMGYWRARDQRAAGAGRPESLREIRSWTAGDLAGVAAGVSDDWRKESTFQAVQDGAAFFWDGVEQKGRGGDELSGRPGVV
jgi:hypothetical protein